LFAQNKLLEKQRKKIRVSEAIFTYLYVITKHTILKRYRSLCFVLQYYNHAGHKTKFLLLKEGNGLDKRAETRES
jgi:hypothetical protein